MGRPALTPEQKLAKLQAQIDALKAEHGLDVPTQEVLAVAAPQVAAAPDATAGFEILANAIAAATTRAITATKPVEKKTILNYKGDTPWHKRDEVKLKLKRKMYQHGQLIDPDMVSNEEIAIMNKLRPGRYFDGFVTVERRRDKGLNFTWPLKTPDQKMRLAMQYGAITIPQILSRCVEEAAAPKKDFVPDEDDF